MFFSTDLNFVRRFLKFTSGYFLGQVTTQHCPIDDVSSANDELKSQLKSKTSDLDKTIGRKWNIMRAAKKLLVQ